MGKHKKQKIFSLQNIVIFLLVIIFIITGAGAGLFFAYIKDAPAFDPEKLKPIETSFVYDDNGQVIAELHGEQNRIPVEISEVPEHLKNAFIAIEDQYFYQHRGINIRSIIGAIWTDLQHGKYRRGASTITQQLVKLAFLSPEKTLKRKAQEAWLAIQLERHYTKDQILEFYLNQVYFGHSAYGVESAAQVYFGKNVSDLTLAESAILAGIPKSPKYYSPYLNYDNSKKRQKIILDTMASLGFISQEEADNAKNEEINLVGLKTAVADYKAPYFTDHAIQELVELLQKKFGFTENEAYNKIYNDGLKIYTTVNMDIQRATEQALANPNNYPYTTKNKNGQLQPQAAAIITDPHTGHIKALVGGRDHKQKLGFNRATQALRQPGSAFKPIVVYTAAIDMGYTPATVVDDAPITYSITSGQTWTPRNYSRNYKGLTTIRKAIADSVNVVAVKVFEDIGIDRGIEYAQKLGIKNLVTDGSRNDRHLSTALGGITKGVTPLELLSAYGTLANDGIHIEPTSIKKVIDKNGRVLIDNKPQKNAVISSQVAYIMTDMLKSVITEGTARRLSGFPFPVAGKTGTTSDVKDVWFVGYTPKFAGVVWMGHDDPKRMRNVGGRPIEIWKQIMTVAHKNQPKTDFVKPKGIVGPISVCIDSGKLPTRLCTIDPRGNRIKSEYFIEGTEPISRCDVHVEKLIDTSTGLLATSSCPRSQVKSRVFIQRPESYDSSIGKVPLDARYEAPTKFCNCGGRGKGLLEDDDYDDNYDDYDEDQDESDNESNDDNREDEDDEDIEPDDTNSENTEEPSENRLMNKIKKRKFKLKL